MKIYMSEDKKLGDSSFDHILRNDSRLYINQTTKAKLQSEEGEKYLKKKEEKEHKRLMSEAEILGL